MIGNTCYGSHKKKIENENVILKHLVNYSSNKYLSYIGSKYNTFFFHEWNLIVIQQQFSLYGQAKILKKWSIDCNAIAVMSKTNELIVLHDYKVKIFQIDSSYNLEKNCKTIFSCPNENMSDSMVYIEEEYLQLSEKNDLIVASMQQQIFFLKKSMEGTWNCINKLDFDYKKYLLNQQGNILIILYYKRLEIFSKSRFEFAIYIKNNMEQWTLLKEMEASSSTSIYVCFCFTICLIKQDQEKFYIIQKKQISDGGLIVTNEGFLINFLSLYNEQTKCYKPKMMKILKLYEH